MEKRKNTKGGVLLKKVKKRRVRIEMSVELTTLMNNDVDEKTQLENIGKVYLSCFGDKDVKIENIRFLD